MLRLDRFVEQDVSIETLDIYTLIIQIEDRLLSYESYKEI